MQYYVLSGSERHGPADIPTLNEWIKQDKLKPETLVENAETGEQMPAKYLAELQFGEEAPAPSPQAEAPGNPAPPQPPQGGAVSPSYSPDTVPPELQGGFNVGAFFLNWYMGAQSPRLLDTSCVCSLCEHHCRDNRWYQGQ